MLRDYEEKFEVAFKLILHLIFNQFQSKQSKDDITSNSQVEQINHSDTQIVTPIIIDDAQLSQISTENQFFVHLLQVFNTLISQNPLPLDPFVKVV